ncbi:MAG: YlmC/YmxH family sporulation protein [Eubacteriales bacterium]|nr:YlmC/YmxH family sporulation protein [Eubacteriales bacterium]
MSVKLSNLQCKEVICVADGRRLGFVTDVLIEMPEGKVTAIVVPGPSRLMGLGGRRDDFIIPWSSIQKVGPDIVLVDIRVDACRVPRSKPKLTPLKE